MSDGGADGYIQGTGGADGFLDEVGQGPGAAEVGDVGGVVAGVDGDLRHGRSGRVQVGDEVFDFDVGVGGGGGKGEKDGEEGILKEDGLPDFSALLFDEGGGGGDD